MSVGRWEKNVPGEVSTANSGAVATIQKGEGLPRPGLLLENLDAEDEQHDRPGLLDALPPY